MLSAAEGFDYQRGGTTYLVIMLHSSRGGVPSRHSWCWGRKGRPDALQCPTATRTKFSAVGESHQHVALKLLQSYANAPLCC